MLEITLFGGLSVQRAGQALALPPSRRARSLLAYLALCPGTAVRRDYLAFTLWPDSAEAQARTNLRGALFDLAHAIPDLADTWSASRQTVGLLDTGCSVDVVEFERLTSATEGDPAPERLAALQRAADLYRGDLLPDLDDAWFDLPRERLRRQAQHALSVLVDGLDQLGRRPEALAAAERLAALDPFDEAAQRHWIGLLARNGRAAPARAAFDRLIERLHAELDAEPAPETLALGRRLREHRASGDGRVVARALAAPPFVASAWPFIGREKALAAIADAWRTALDERGRISFLAGDPGMGKTRLLQEAISRLRPQPNASLVARARPEATSPFGPLVDAVRRALADLPAAAWPALPAPWDAALAPFLPELSGTSPLGDLRRHQVHEAWTLLLHGFGEPLLLAIDDLQWLDEATTGFLSDFLDRLASRAILVVATARPGEIDPTTGPGALLARAPRLDVGDRLDLAPLDPAEGRALVHAVARDLTPEYADQLSHRGAGHPLFLVELARAAGAAGFSLGGFALPNSVRSLVGEQVGRLPADGQSLVQALSIVGAAPVPLLGRILSWPPDRLAAACVAPLAQGLLTEAIDTERGQTPPLSFSHDLVREAVDEGLSGPQRRLWHLRAAEALRHPRRPEHLAQAAEHFLAAGEASEAIPLLLDAAEVDLAHAAPDSAEARFSLAVELAATAGSAPEAPAWRRAQIGLGGARLAAGRPVPAEAALRSALQSARQERDPAAEIQALAGLLEAAYARDRIPEAIEHYRALIARPLDVADAAAARGLIRATLWVIPVFATLRPLFDEARAALDRALAIAEATGDRSAGEQLAAHRVLLTSQLRGPWPAAASEYRRLGAHFFLSWLLVWSGRPREAVPVAELAAELAHRQFDHAGVGAARTMQALAVAFQGNYRAGLELSDRALAQVAGHAEQGRLWSAANRCVLYRELGLWEQVRAEAEVHRIAAAKLGAPDTMVHALAATADLQAGARLGDPQPALAEATRLAAQLTGPDYLLDRLLARLAEADIALFIGQPAHALRAAHQALAAAEAIRAPRELAHAHRLRALALRRTGSPDAAQDALRRARAAAESVTEPTLHWRLLQAQAELQPATVDRALLAATESIRVNLPSALQPRFALPGA